MISHGKTRRTGSSGFVFRLLMVDMMRRRASWLIAAISGDLLPNLVGLEKRK
jgi:hypothetical protein